MTATCGNSSTSVSFRTANDSFLAVLRKFFCFKVAFIAPREVSRSRVRCGLARQPFNRTRLSSRGAMKATWVAANGRAGFSVVPHESSGLVNGSAF